MQIYPNSTESFKLAAKAILNEELVILPTETVYGLAANALSNKGANKIFTAKNRPYKNPLIIHFYDIKHLSQYVDISEALINKITQIGNAPITYIFNCKNNCKISNIALANNKTIAVRIPELDITRKVIEFANVPIAMPSANFSGEISPTELKHISQTVTNRVDCAIDNGKCKYGIESTVIDLRDENNCKILRYGSYTEENISSIFNITTNSKIKEIVSPGTNFKHYQPGCPVIIGIDKAGINDGIIVCGKNIPNLKCKKIINLSQNFDHLEIANNLFSAFYELNKVGVSNIYIDLLPEEGILKAVNDRIKRASQG